MWTKSVLQYLDRQSPLRLGLVACLSMAFIGAADYGTGTELSFSIFYLIPTALAAWANGRSAGALFSLVGAFTWFWANSAAGGSHGPLWIDLWNTAARFGIFFVVASLLMMLRRELLREQTLARTDSLTGAMNSRGFFERLDLELRRAARSGRPLAVAYLDVDGFKEVNDTYGHRGGDEVLMTIAYTCLSALRATDAVGRLGGDEFALALPETDEAGARQAVERVVGDLQAVMRQRRWPVTFSVGVATALNGSLDAEGLVSAADQLMYKVKTRGGSAAAYYVDACHMDTYDASEVDSRTAG